MGQSAGLLTDGLWSKDHRTAQQYQQERQAWRKPNEKTRKTHEESTTFLLKPLGLPMSTFQIKNHSARQARQKGEEERPFRIAITANNGICKVSHPVQAILAQK
jgi:hypothetical protein